MSLIGFLKGLALGYGVDNGTIMFAQKLRSITNRLGGTGQRAIEIAGWLMIKYLCLVLLWWIVSASWYSDRITSRLRHFLVGA